MLHTLRQARAGVTNRLDEARKTDKKLAQAGFTLIELLIVIVILGILAAVVVFSVQGIQDKGEAAACKSDVASVVTASEAYYAQNHAYTNVAGLVTAKLLHSAPDATEYVISVASDGKVTVALPAAGGISADALAECQKVSDDA